VSHLNNAVLRRYVDEPDALLSFKKEHLLQCAGCRGKLELYRERAALAAAHLPNPGEVDMQAAHRGILAKTSANGVPEFGSPALALSARSGASPRRLAWVGALAAGVALFFAIGYTPVRGYAQEFLAIFEPNQFQPIALTANDITQLHALPELKGFGTMRQSNKLIYKSFPDIGSASGFARAPILRPSFVPPGVPETPYYRVSGTQKVTFTFSAAKAPAMPKAIDGSVLSASLGPVILQTYGVEPEIARHKGDAGSHRLPKDILMITQAPAPHIFSTKATVAQIEAYLLAQPGLSPGLVAQIRAIGDPTTTLPVPIRIDKQTAQTVTVNGASGLLVGDNTGVGSLVVWQRSGWIYCVAGPYSASQILQVANSMTS
jgi:hypothetical protein